MSTQVVLLMAGAGSRFASVGFRESKPLIPVNGEPMFRRALDSLEGLERATRTTYVVREQQIHDEGIDDVIRQSDADPHIVALPRLTGGAAESAIAAVGALDAHAPVLVLDCDLWFRSASYTRAANSVALGRAADSAVLLTFQASESRYSYVATTSDGRVTSIAEKRVISSHAVGGSYFFSSAAVFAEAADDARADLPASGEAEFYMSAVVRALLRMEKRVSAWPADDYLSFGTPEELRANAAAAGG